MRVLCLLTLAIYAITTHVPFAHARTLSMSAKSMAIDSATPLPNDPSDILIPEDLARIADSYQGHSDKVVILIQDAHAIPDAQRRIQKLIGHLQANYETDHVVLEGAASSLDAQIFHSFPDKQVLQDVLNDYYDQGEVTGATAAIILSDSTKGAAYHGMENWELYQAGVRAFQEAMDKEANALEKIDELTRQLEARKQEIYPEELLAIDQSLRDFYGNFTNLIPTLIKLAAIKAPEAGSELALLLEESKQSGEVSAEVETEVRKLSSKIQHFLKYKAELGDNNGKLREFNAKFQAFQTQQLTAQAFALFLRNLTADQRLPVKVSAELLSRMQNEKRMHDIKGTRLFSDFEAYAENVKALLFENDEQRDLDRQGKHLQLLERLAKLELTHEDWEAVKSTVDSDLWADLQPHIAFYKNAEARDKALFNNFLKLDSQSAIMIAGGFHAEGLTRQLQDNGISYLLLMPQFSELPEETSYRAHMRGEMSWSKYFEIENGRVDLRKAFIRGTRDKLVAKAQEHEGTLKKNVKSFTLKSWRDQIIRDLAERNEIAKARQYTRFIDEARAEAPARGRQAIPSAMARVERFLSGIQRLDASNQLTEQRIVQLIGATTILDLAGNVSLSGDPIAPELLGMQITERPSGLVVAERASIDVPRELVVDAGRAENRDTERGKGSPSSSPGDEQQIQAQAVAIDQMVLFPIQLAMEELLINAITNAGASDRPGEVLVAVEKLSQVRLEVIDDEILRVIIEDNGPGFSFEALDAAARIFHEEYLKLFEAANGREFYESGVGSPSEIQDFQVWFSAVEAIVSGTDDWNHYHTFFFGMPMGEAALTGRNPGLDSSLFRSINRITGAIVEGSERDGIIARTTKEEVQTGLWNLVFGITANKAKLGVPGSRGRPLAWEFYGKRFKPEGGGFQSENQPFQTEAGRTPYGFRIVMDTPIRSLLSDKTVTLDNRQRAAIVEEYKAFVRGLAESAKGLAERKGRGVKVTMTGLDPATPQQVDQTTTVEEQGDRQEHRSTETFQYGQDSITTRPAGELANEDVVVVNEDMQLLLLADGVGFLDEGKEAAQIASRAISEYLDSRRSDIERAKSPNVVEDILVEAFRRAHDEIAAKGIRRGASVGAFLVWTDSLGRRYLVGINVGNTRLLLRSADGNSEVLSREDTPARLDIEAARISRNAADRDKTNRLALLEFVGRSPNIEAGDEGFQLQDHHRIRDANRDFIQLSPRDQVLLLSSGIVHNLAQQGIRQIVASHENLPRIVDELISQARNISASPDESERDYAVRTDLSTAAIEVPRLQPLNASALDQEELTVTSSTIFERVDADSVRAFPVRGRQRLAPGSIFRVGDHYFQVLARTGQDIIIARARRTRESTDDSARILVRNARGLVEDERRPHPGYTIGRQLKQGESHGADIQLRGEGIPKLQANVYSDKGGDLFLGSIDSSSETQVYLEAQALKQDTLLNVGDVVGFGEYTFQVTDISASGVKLEFVKGDEGKPREIHLRPGSLRRADGLTIGSNGKGVSGNTDASTFDEDKRHLRFFVDGDGFKVKPLSDDLNAQLYRSPTRGLLGAEETERKISGREDKQRPREAVLKQGSIFQIGGYHQYQVLSINDEGVILFETRIDRPELGRFRFISRSSLERAEGVIFGRSDIAADIHVSHDTVSKIHASLHMIGNALLLRDIPSSNDTPVYRAESFNDQITERPATEQSPLFIDTGGRSSDVVSDEGLQQLGTVTHSNESVLQRRRPSRSSRNWLGAIGLGRRSGEKRRDAPKPPPRAKAGEKTSSGSPDFTALDADAPDVAGAMKEAAGTPAADQPQTPEPAPTPKRPDPVTTRFTGDRTFVYTQPIRIELPGGATLIITTGPDLSELLPEDQEPLANMVREAPGYFIYPPADVMKIEAIDPGRSKTNSKIGISIGHNVEGIFRISYTGQGELIVTGPSPISTTEPPSSGDRAEIRDLGDLEEDLPQPYEDGYQELKTIVDFLAPREAELAEQYESKLANEGARDQLLDFYIVARHLLDRHNVVNEESESDTYLELLRMYTNEIIAPLFSPDPLTAEERSIQQILVSFHSTAARNIRSFIERVHLAVERDDWVASALLRIDLQQAIKRRESWLNTPGAFLVGVNSVIEKAGGEPFTKEEWDKLKLASSILLGSGIIEFRPDAFGSVKTVDIYPDVLANSNAFQLALMIINVSMRTIIEASDRYERVKSIARAKLQGSVEHGQIQNPLTDREDTIYQTLEEIEVRLVQAEFSLAHLEDLINKIGYEKADPENLLQEIEGEHRLATQAVDLVNDVIADFEATGLGWIAELEQGWKAIPARIEAVREMADRQEIRSINGLGGADSFRSRAINAGLSSDPQRNNQYLGELRRRQGQPQQQAVSPAQDADEVVISDYGIVRGRLAEILAQNGTTHFVPNGNNGTALRSRPERVMYEQNEGSVLQQIRTENLGDLAKISGPLQWVLVPRNVVHDLLSNEALPMAGEIIDRLAEGGAMVVVYERELQPRPAGPGFVDGRTSEGIPYVIATKLPETTDGVREEKRRPLEDLSAMDNLLSAVIDPVRVGIARNELLNAARSARNEIRNVGMQEFIKLFRNRALDRLRGLGGPQQLVQQLAVEHKIRQWTALLQTDAFKDIELSLGFNLSDEDGALQAQNLIDAILDNNVSDKLLSVIFSGNIRPVQSFRGVLREADIRMTTMKKIDRVRSAQLISQAVLPVVHKSADLDTSNQLLVEVGVNKGGVEDPILEIGETVLQVVAALLLARQVQDRSEINAQTLQRHLLDQLFPNFGQRQDAIIFNADGSLTVQRVALRAYLQYVAEHEVAIAA